MSKPAQEGSPVTVSLTMNASGKQHVDDLLAMMKAAGVSGAEEVGPATMPMRQDMERLRSITAEPDEMNAMPSASTELTVPGTETSTSGNPGAYMRKPADGLDQSTSTETFKINAKDRDGEAELRRLAGMPSGDTDAEEGYENEPDPEEMPGSDTGGGINRSKNSYSDAEDGDNPMAVKEGGYGVKSGEIHDDDEGLTIAWEASEDGIEVYAYDADDNEVDLDSAAERHWIGVVEAHLEDEYNDAGDAKQHAQSDDRYESIKHSLHAALSEKMNEAKKPSWEKEGSWSKQMKKQEKEASPKKKSKVKESQGGVQHNLMYMELGALNSGKGKKFFMLDTPKPGTPERFKHLMNNHPAAQRLSQEGYVGPRQVAAWEGDINDALEKAHDMINTPRVLDSFKREAEKKIKDLTVARKIIDSGSLEENLDQDVAEVSKKTLGSYAKKASGSSHPNSAPNLSSKAAYALGKADHDDYAAGEKDDKKSARRSKYIGKAIDKLSK
jgi:hypothetical protein